MERRQKTKAFDPKKDEVLPLLLGYVRPILEDVKRFFKWLFFELRLAVL